MLGKQHLENPEALTAQKRGPWPRRLGDTGAAGGSGGGTVTRVTSAARAPSSLCSDCMLFIQNHDTPSRRFHLSPVGAAHSLPAGVRAGAHGAAAAPTLGCAGQSPTVAVSPRGTMQPALRKEAACAPLRPVSSRCAYAAAWDRKEALAGDTGHALGLVSQEHPGLPRTHQRSELGGLGAGPLRPTNSADRRAGACPPASAPV